MKAMYLCLTLFLIGLMTLSPQANAIDSETFSKIDELMSRYETDDQGLIKVELDQAMEDHRKITQFTRNFGAFLRDKIEKEIDLSGPEVNLIRAALSSFIKLTAFIDEQLEKQIIFSPERHITPEKLATWLYRRITVTENFKAILSLYYNEKMLRRIIHYQKKYNSANHTFTRVFDVLEAVHDQMQYNPYELFILDDLTKKILSSKRAEQVSSLITNLHAMTSGKEHLREPLNSTVTYQLFKQSRSLEPIYSEDVFWSDAFASVTTGLTRGLSWAFGASVGDIEWGPGKLYKNQAFIEEMQDELQPLDLVFEKKTYKLTDYTIPGHWGHVGLWLGTEEQLRNLGIWEDPALDVFREQIKNGNSIYEVRRWGLNFDNMENFSNLDEFLITRVEGLNQQKRSEVALIYQNLAEQIDKTYDFTFNALATDRTTCTEIIYLSYGPINWPSDIILGRRTISPNNIAELVFYRNSPLKLVRYIGSNDKGEMVEKDKVDLSKTVGYAPMRDEDGEVHFDQIQRKCQRVRRRVGGGLRFRNECENEYVTKRYNPVTSFLLRP